MIRPLGEKNTTPSEELSHFTNRVDEIAAFNRILEIPDGQPIPLLMFYGVGGAGKSWLLKRMRQQTQTIPTVFLDLDPGSSDQPFRNNPSRAFAEIRRQLGDSVKCPRFDLAYAWLRYKEGDSDEPLFKGSGALGNAWELLVEAGDAAASDIPGASLVTWLVNKVASPVKNWLEKSGVLDWITSELGQEDFLKLKGLHYTDIYPELNERLLQDLQEHLPENNGCCARAVVYLDTIETLREDRSSQEKLESAQTWLRNLYHPDSGLFVVMSGRDRLQWDRDSASEYANPNHLEQHLVGGLSEPDAVSFLDNCGIVDPSLQSAILATSLDTETHLLRSDQPKGYHPYSLGLCADTCWNLSQRGEAVDPNSFDMSSADTHALAIRFLRSMGGDGTYAEWLKSLALTPQFDETVARESFSEHAGAEQDAAWQTLTNYSFFRQTQQPGWFTLHARMRESLADRQQVDNSTLWQTRHGWWHHYWQDRSDDPTDVLAARAWYHSWCTVPDTATSQWNKLAETARQELRMVDHSALLDWWTPCEFNTAADDGVLRGQHAVALNSLAVELGRATLGDRAANIQRAIACYEAALRVYTEEAFPQQWAMTQNNLAIAYRNIPGGDRAANIQRAIACYEAALRVYTEEAFPREYKIVKDGLENTRKLLE